MVEAFESFVTAPIGYSLFNVALAVALSITVVVAPTNSDDSDYALLEQAITMSNYVSTAAISIVTLTFSLTVLSIQIAAQSYSPRLLDDFLKDPVSKIVISVNLGAYAFCFTLQYFLYPSADDDNKNVIPLVSIHLLSVHMALVIVSFVNFIHFFINGFRIEKILERAAASSLRAAQALSRHHHDPSLLAATTTMSEDNSASSSSNQQNKKRSLHLEELVGEGEPDDEQVAAPSFAYKVLADKSGYVKSFRLHNVVPLAQKLDVCVRYCYQIGEFVNEGTILCYIWEVNNNTTDQNENGDSAASADHSASRESMEKRIVNLVRVDDYAAEEEVNNQMSAEQQVERRLGILASKGIKISKLRTSDLDVTLGIQQLSDIAVRALSQAINDPHTAIQCMDTLSSLFTALGVMKLGVPNAQDKRGIIRACAPRRSFSFLLSLLDTIRRYGASDLGVCRRGLRLFGDLASILIRAKRFDRVVPTLAQLQEWMAVSRDNFAEGSPELINLQELYDHLLETISEAEVLVLKKQQHVENDLQFLNTTLESTRDEASMTSKEKSLLQFVRSVDAAKALSEGRRRESFLSRPSVNSATSATIKENKQMLLEILRDDFTGS